MTPMKSNWFSSRRRFLIATGATLLTAFLPGTVGALTESEASTLIGRVVKDVNSVINSGKSESAMYTEFERILVKYSDINIIARSSLGAPWRTASPAQQSAYTKAFQHYMSVTWGGRFREFIGGEITVHGVKKIKNGYLVESQANLKGSAPFVVEWHVSDKSGQDKMVNLYIEGISLLSTERTEIAAMLDKRGGNLDQLISDLRNWK